MVISRKEVPTTCGVMQAIKQADCLIACITSQVVSTSFRLVTSNPLNLGILSQAMVAEKGHPPAVLPLTDALSGTAAA